MLILIPLFSDVLPAIALQNRHHCAIKGDFKVDEYLVIMERIVFEKL